MKKTTTKLWLTMLMIVIFSSSGYAATLNANSSNYVSVYNAASDGDIILLDAGTYSTGITFPTSKSITIKGNPNAASLPVITFQLSDAIGTTGGTLTFDGVMIDRANADYFYSSATANLNIILLKFANCKIQNIKKSLINTTSQTGNITNISIDNCIITASGTSKTSFIFVSQLLNTFSVSNSTIYNYIGGDFFKPNNISTSNTLALSYVNNTMYHSVWDKGYGWASIDSRYSATSTYLFKNNIFDTGANGTANAPIFVYKGGVQTEQNNVKIAYGSSSNQAGGSLSSSNLTTTSLSYTDPGIGNFKITSVSPTLDLSTAGVGSSMVGDPRWYQTSTITTGATSITGINYNLNSNTPTIKSLSINAILPSSQLTVSAPANYEISTNASSGFGSSLTLGTPWYNLSTTIFVKMKDGLSAGSYNNENISISATGITALNISCSGTASNASALSTPTGLTTTAISYNGFHAAWNSVPDATEYQVKIYQNGVLISTVNGINSNSADISGLSQTTSYTFKVVAIGDGVNYSNSADSETSESFSTLTLNLNTSLNIAEAGTVSRGSNAPYIVGQSVQLTASRNFGYQFVKWVDATTESELSTSNPYTVTLNETKNIKAVFNAIPTYNFTVNKNGTGANWGNVTISPSPAGGKEEGGAIVTMTPVSNIVATFSQWNDAGTGAKTVTVSSDASYTATFTATPFIVAWDFPTTANVQNRAADYYLNSSNQGVVRLFKTDGLNEFWTFGTFAGKNGMRRWTSYADIVTNKKCRYYQAEFSSKGYKNITVASKITYDNYCVNATQKLQYSLDGTNFTDVSTYTFVQADKNQWCTLSGTLPSAADNATIVYIRWIGDVNTATVPGGTPNSGDTEGFFLTDILVAGTQLAATASAGDYVATTSGDISNPSNWNVSGGTLGISGNASSAPSASNNLIIPAGITMTNASTATCNNLQIKGNYTAAAPLAIAGNLIIKSDAEGTGTLIANGNVSVSGTSTVQQYLKDARNWYVSSPVSNASVPAGYTCYQYDETGNHPSAIGPYWFTKTTGESLTPGIGYIALPNAAASTLEFSTAAGGTLNNGNVAIALTQSGAQKTGFNLIGNPYPAHLTWTQAFVDNNSSLINPTIWYRTNSGTTNAGSQWAFLTYNAHSGEGSPAGTTGIIPPMQAFWIKAVSTGILTLNNDLLVSHQSGNPLKVLGAEQTQRQRLRLQLSNKTSSDETLIYFDAAASTEFDAADSPKMSYNNGSMPELFTTAGTEKLVINGMNTSDVGSEFPLGYTIGKIDTLTISAIQVSNFDQDIQVLLKDNALNIETDLTNGNGYTFSTEAISTKDRFSILLKSIGIATQNPDNWSNQLTIRVKNNQVMISCPESMFGNTTLKIYNSTGQLCASQNISSTQTTLSGQFIPGVYIICAESVLGKITRKLTIK